MIGAMLVRTVTSRFIVEVTLITTKAWYLSLSTRTLWGLRMSTDVLSMMRL